MMTSQKLRLHHSKHKPKALVMTTNQVQAQTVRLMSEDYDMRLGQVITSAQSGSEEFKAQTQKAQKKLGLGVRINLDELEKLEQELGLGQGQDLNDSEHRAEPSSVNTSVNTNAQVGFDPNSTELPSNAMIEQVLNSLGDVYGRPKNDKRLAPLTQRKSWHVTEMWDLHHQIKNRIFLGQKNSEIAKSLNCNPQTVCFVRNSPIVQAQLMIMRRSADMAVGELKQELLELAPKATQVLEQLLVSEGTAQALKAKIAMDILDRVGVSEPKQIQGSVLHLTGDDVERIKQRAVQLGSSAGFVVDADFQEVSSAA